MNKIDPSVLVPGELVGLSFQARYVDGSEAGHHRFEVQDVTGKAYELWLARGTMSAVDVVRIAPPEWPPRLGDLWVDAHGQEWFAAGQHGKAEPDLVGDTSGRQDPQAVADWYGPMMLVRRRDAAPGATRELPVVGTGTEPTTYASGAAGELPGWVDELNSAAAEPEAGGETVEDAGPPVGAISGRDLLTLGGDLIPLPTGGTPLGGELDG